MGLDISTNLIVGVPLLNLGDIQEESEEKSLVDPLGNPTGRTASLKQVYLVALNGNRYLVGSNQNSIGRHGNVEYFYTSIFGNGVGNWTHLSDYMGGPSQVVIGLQPESIKGPEIGDHDSFKAVQSRTIQTYVVEVGKNLQEKFGYEGEIYVISQVYYSY